MRPRRAAGDIYVHRDDPIDTTDGCVISPENSSADSTGADRDYDLIHHPHRVLSQCDRASSFYGLVVAAALTSSVLLLLLSRPIAPFLLLCGAKLLWYAQVPGRTRRTILGRHVLLLKYPAFVWLIAPAHPPQLFVSMFIVYVSSAVYEVLHDRTALRESQ